MRWLVLLLSLGGLLGVQAASAATVSIRPAADVGFPFWCYRAASGAVVTNSAANGTVGFDVTALVRLWHRGLAPNYGLLLKLADWQEDIDVSGPAFPSSAFPDPAQRPQLVVGYTPATG